MTGQAETSPAEVQKPVAQQPVAQQPRAQQADPPEARLRVMNLGLPKTGTSTLNRALRRAGMRVADWRIKPRQTQNTAIHNKHVGNLLYEGYFGTGDPLALLDDFDAITEMSYVKFKFTAWPQTDWGLLSAMIDLHPGTKFLLCCRDPLDTARSMLRWNNLGEKRLPLNSIPGLPRGFGKTEDELARWIEGHYRFCRRVFAGSDRFFEYELADPDPSDKIGAFLDRDLPWWGQVNRNKAAMPQGTV